MLNFKNRKDGVLFIEIGKTIRKAGLEEELKFRFGTLSLHCVRFIQVDLPSRLLEVWSSKMTPGVET